MGVERGTEREYLEKLSDLESGKHSEPVDRNIRPEQRVSYVPGQPPRGQSSGQPPEQSDPSLTSTAAISVPIEECEPVHVIDMNTASEEILSAIPEIGPELAPRVIVERMNRRGIPQSGAQAGVVFCDDFQAQTPGQIPIAPSIGRV